MSSFQSPRQTQQNGSSAHRQSSSAADVSHSTLSPPPSSNNMQRARSTYTAASDSFRGYRRLEARRTMDESQLMNHRARAANLNPPIDYRMLDYVVKCDDNLICAICRCPFVDPVVLAECDHWFCRDCIGRTWEDRSPLGSRGNCPACRTLANLGPRSATTKILRNLLDELPVHCPREGCEATVKRGEVQDHVTLYCGHSRIECPVPECTRTILRKDSTQGCLHYPVSCIDCQKTMVQADLNQHWKTQCPDLKIVCALCEVDVFCRELDEHNKQSCPAISIPCPGHEFGCTVRLKRSRLDAHVKECALAKLTPFMNAQKQRLDEQQMAQRQINRKLERLELGLANLQRLSEYEYSDPDSASANERSIPHLSVHTRMESFAAAYPAMADEYSIPDSPVDLGVYSPPRALYASSVAATAGTRNGSFTDNSDAGLPYTTVHGPHTTPIHGPYTSPIHHLLSMHEGLRDEVTRMSAALSELDGRQSMQVLNESLRNREELAYLGGQIGGMTRQLHWLTSAQLQRHQGVSSTEFGEVASAGVGVEMAVSSIANAASALRGAARLVRRGESSSAPAASGSSTLRRGTSEENRTKL